MASHYFDQLISHSQTLAHTVPAVMFTDVPAQKGVISSTQMVELAMPHPQILSLTV